MFPFITVLPEHRNEGHLSKWLDSLSRHDTIVFPEVMTTTKLGPMLTRRGFHETFLSDDDRPGFAFMCYVREGTDQGRALGKRIIVVDDDGKPMGEYSEQN